MSKRLQSFDVFDTLLTRRVSVPRDLFRIVGTKMAATGLLRLERADFAARRVLAEKEARQEVSHHEINLAEIYERLANEFNWEPRKAEQAMQIEIEAESRSLCAVPGMTQTVHAAREWADQILFLTDMYLPSAFIEKLLRREGFFRDGDRLLVSGESGRSKNNGEMYGAVKRLYPETVEWRHRGDNLHSDVKMARQFGIQATLDSRCHLTRYEQLARGSDLETSVWRSQLSAAMRLARLENTEANDQRRVIWESGSNVVGPLLFGFVHWCLETAERRGLRRLYFVARDGQILHRIAKIIAANWDYAVECRYHYGSRQAWNPAAIDRFTRADLPKIFVPFESISVQQAFNRVGLKAEDFRAQLVKFGLGERNSDWSSPLSPEARQRLKDCLLEPESVAAIERVARNRREVLLAYLKQEGIFEDVPFALVDIGWFGNLQNSLTQVLELAGHASVPKVAGLYFNLLRGSKTPAKPERLAYWRDCASRNNAWRRQYIMLFEIFTAADHGSVLGFEWKEGRVVPKLGGEKNLRALDWGLAALQESVVQFANEFSRNIGRKSFLPTEFFAISRRLLEELYRNPSRAEASAWGSFQHSSGQTEYAFEQLVPDWNRRQILAALWDRRRQPVYWWHEGTQAVSPCLPMSVFLCLKRMKQSWKRMVERK